MEFIIVKMALMVFLILEDRNTLVLSQKYLKEVDVWEYSQTQKIKTHQRSITMPTEAIRVVLGVLHLLQWLIEIWRGYKLMELRKPINLKEQIHSQDTLNMSHSPRKVIKISQNPILITLDIYNNLHPLHTFKTISSNKNTMIVIQNIRTTKPQRKRLI